MPDIDVTEILSDSDIAGVPFVVVRREEVVNVHGESELVETRIDAVGSVQPTGDNSLVREEAYQTQAKTLKVVTTFLLRGESKAAGRSYQPDLVLWQGDYYLVRTVEDYSQYGAGMVDAECTSVDHVDDAPIAKPRAIGMLDFSNSGNSGLGGGNL